MRAFIQRLIGSALRRRRVPDDMAWFCPPCDVHAAEPWDRYWEAQLEHGMGPSIQDMFCRDDALLDATEARGLRTVLCVGSGISQEPHALAAAGLDVVAMDLSPFAMRFASGLSFHADPWPFFDSKRVRAGGSVSFAVGDLLDPTVCPGPFDVIIERSTLQLFSENERAAALDAVKTRLSERGILFTHCHDGLWRPPASPKHYVEPLLPQAGFHVVHYGWPIPATGRVALVFTSTG